MTSSRPRLQWMPCFAAGGALLGLCTTLERVAHHTHAYTLPSAAVLHASFALLVGGALGALLGGALDLIDSAVGRTAVGRVRAACAAGALTGALLYFAVIGVSKYGKLIPRPAGALAFGALAALCVYGASKLVPIAARRAGVLRWALLGLVVLVSWVDLHAYVRSYGNVHVFLSTLALLGAGATVALFAPNPQRLRRGLGVALPLALLGALVPASSHAAKNAVLQLGAIEKLVIQHLLWRAFDRDGDGAAVLPLGADCDDRDARNAPLRWPLRAPSLGCAPLAAAAPLPPPQAPALVPQRDLVWVVVDTWRTDTPAAMPAWTHGFTHLRNYRSCGSRTEQVLSQLLGSGGCAKAIPSSSLAGLLGDAGYELVHMGEYPDATGRFPPSQEVGSRAALLSQARTFFAQRKDQRRLFAIVHFKGGHAPYDGEGGSARARYADAIDQTLAAVGELLKVLPQQAVVVVAGDHGEEFGEHDADTHALSLYEEVLRTPVFVRAPSLTAGLDAGALECAGLAELIAALVSDAPAPAPRELRSFAVVAAPRGVHGGLSETVSYATIDGRGLKLIWQPRLDLFELYDLRRDPREKHNLADARPEVLRAMAGVLAERVQSCGGEETF